MGDKNNRGTHVDRALLGLAVYAMSDSGSADAPMLHQTRTLEIAAPPAQVWAVIENFADLTWHPAIKASTATMGNTIGSVRTLDLGGPKLQERLTAYDVGAMTYTYVITDDPANLKTMPVTEYTSTIVVQPSASGSLATWSGTFRRVDPSHTPAAGQDDKTALDAIAGVYDGGLAALQAKLAGPG
jgi:hypothetical protein